MTPPDTHGLQDHADPPALAARHFVRVEGTTWPNPNDPTEVQWRLRYGTPSKSDLLIAASFMHAYAYLLSMSQKDRNHRVATIREAVDGT